MKPFRWPALIGLLLAAVLVHAVPQMVHAESMTHMDVLSCANCGGGTATGGMDCATQCLKTAEETRNGLLPKTERGSAVAVAVFSVAAFFLAQPFRNPNESDPVPIGPRLIAGLAMRE